MSVDAGSDRKQWHRTAARGIVAATLGVQLVGAVWATEKIYLAVYGNGIDLQYLTDVDAARSAWGAARTVSEAAEEMATAVFGGVFLMLIVSALLFRWPWSTAREWGQNDRPSADSGRLRTRLRGSVPTVGWRMVIGASAVTFVLARGGSELGPWIDRWTPLTLTVPSVDEPVMVGVFEAVKAAFGEELIVVAVPVMILRYFEPRIGAGRTRLLVRAGWVGCGLTGFVAMRVAYHLYQGTAVIWLLPWAIWTVWAFWRWRHPGLLLGLIAAHFINNVSSELPHADTARRVLLVFALVLVVATLVWPTGQRSWLRTPAITARPDWLDHARAWTPVISSGLSGIIRAVQNCRRRRPSQNRREERAL